MTKSIVYDISNGNKLILPTEVFYTKFRVKRTEELRFKEVKEIKRDKSGTTLRFIPDAKQFDAFYDSICVKQRNFGRHI